MPGDTQKYGLLSVLEIHKPKLHKMARCKCDCGTEKVIRLAHLISGATKSCGCYRKSFAKTHGMSKSHLYLRWRGMIQRVTNKSHKMAYRYIDRGINVCDEWMFFDPFMKWAMSNGFDDSLELDRINNDLGYSPNNCRWVDRSTNQANRSSFKNKTTGSDLPLGVKKMKSKYQSRISFNNITHCLGVYDTPIEAGLARDKYIAANKLPHKLSIGSS